MQGLVLQLTRFGFLLLLWLFVYAVIRDHPPTSAPRVAYASSGATAGPRRPCGKGSGPLPVVTHGASPTPASHSAHSPC